MLLAGHDAAAGVALLLEEHQHAGLQVADVDAEAVQQLLVPGAVSAGLIDHEIPVLSVWMFPHYTTVPRKVVLPISNFATLEKSFP